MSRSALSFCPTFKALKGAQRVRPEWESNHSAPSSPQPSEQGLTRAPAPGGRTGSPSLLALLQGFPDWLQYLSNINLFCFQVTLTMKYSALSDDADLDTHITTTSAQMASIHGRGPDMEQLGLEATSKKRKHHAYFLCSWASISFRILFPQIQNIVRVTFH